jgi:hypothetical protein
MCSLLFTGSTSCRWRGLVKVICRSSDFFALNRLFRCDVKLIITWPYLFGSQKNIFSNWKVKINCLQFLYLTEEKYNLPNSSHHCRRPFRVLLSEITELLIHHIGCPKSSKPLHWPRAHGMFGTVQRNTPKVILYLKAI